MACKCLKTKSLEQLLSTKYVKLWVATLENNPHFLTKGVFSWKFDLVFFFIHTDLTERKISKKIAYGNQDIT